MDGPVPPRYFLLQSYLLKNRGQAQQFWSCLRRARSGRTNGLATAAPAIILEALVAAHLPQMLAVSAFASLEELDAMKRKLLPDGAALDAMARWEEGEEPPYNELIETVLEAAEYSSGLPAQLPSLDLVSKTPRVFELRTYHCPTTRQLRALHERFAGPGIRIFHRCGIHPVLYTSTLIGGARPSLTYLTPFDNLASREKAWAAFNADPHWVKLREESIARYGQIPSVIQISLFKAAA